MRRPALFGLAALVVVLVALGFGVRRLSPGQAGWASKRGTLLRAGTGSAYVARWAWRPAGDGRVTCRLAAASREGARVDVSLDVAFPPGRYTLAAAATPEEEMPQEDRLFLKDDVTTESWADRFIRRIERNEALSLVAETDGRIVAEATLYRPQHG